VGVVVGTEAEDVVECDAGKDIGSGAVTRVARIGVGGGVRARIEVCASWGAQVGMVK
jgi:hypothetical protein